MVFKNGDVLKVEWDERPIRVIMADPIEVFYDLFWPEGIGWGLARARTAIYYRTTTEFLSKNATKIRSEPLTRKEVTRHRPDLPMRLLRSDKASWFDDVFPSEIVANVSINANQLALIPFGAKGASLKPRKVYSSNGCFFSGVELLAAARDAQNATCSDVSGIGLYRSGISGGIPSYYLWGAIDRAGHAI